MKSIIQFAVSHRVSIAAAILLAGSAHVCAEWQRTDSALAWRAGDQTVWSFSFDAKRGKPFFNPVSVAGGPSLTSFRPEDHPWHYGLWFSWKYINRANYWEEDRQSGKAEGATRWSAPAIETKPDGSAMIRLELTYTHPQGRVDLTERRELRVSAPGPDGSYAIDWNARFTAGPEKVVLDRTPMPGEPKGAVNGGYAGLGLRMAGTPLAIAFISVEGPVTEFKSDRARPFTPAVACNFMEGTSPAGAIAILSDPANAGERAPWYLINSTQMRFACSAILAPQPRTIEAGGTMTLRYRMAVRRAPWTPESLRAAHADWLRSDGAAK